MHCLLENAVQDMITRNIRRARPVVKDELTMSHRAHPFSLLLLPTLLAGLACAETRAVGPFTVQIDTQPLRLSVTNAGRTLMASRDALGLIRAGRAKPQVKSSFGRFAFDQ